MCVKMFANDSVFLLQASDRSLKVSKQNPEINQKYIYIHIYWKTFLLNLYNKTFNCTCKKMGFFRF